ncbi:hypothetical protein GCM10011487_19630 [Steroidobacter agaridevorans]|uniref:DUF1223 domain-containing protein n=1 Tax=Steroidobacter agaridevorans TaxID=2695856 RepID=A0A829YAE4_9GAMM|nr:DUF1223 domain-containing protein [Steroidobacter agaridevorans]GFE79963.1 hypothetical protein GCM10011487_19630 [Steroidobacter agaridevorans]GFE90067.1 hypothetical protein GCM10011488_50210 [Steroidobacter agaridevorans]
MSIIIRAWLALLGLVGSAVAFAQPVVVELFTSQGCSSCPPADVLIGELARRPGVIALAYHVDYWDDRGWQDRFSLPEATLRQRGYVRRLEKSGAFTPQIVVSGDTSLVGSNRTAVEKAVAGDRDALRMSLSKEGNSLYIYFLEAWRESMDVFLVSYLKEATDRIDGGENAHRTLKHFNVVRSFKKLGTWNGKPQRMVAPLAELPRDASAVAVILQRKNQGAVAGAASFTLH